MSSTSNSESCLTSVACRSHDNGTKGAPTTSSTAAPQSVPAPLRFHKRLAFVEVNILLFEQGFDDHWVEGGISSHVMCSICRELPRRSATPDGCVHIFCDRCIKQHYQLRATSHAPCSPVKGAPCPTCMQGFSVGEILTWPAWQLWAQLSFNARVVRCPND